MNLKRTLPVNRKAWFMFSSVLFGLCWLLWIPVQSNPPAYFWELWPAFFNDPENRVQIGLWLAVSTIAFLAAAVCFGWILQFLWSLLTSIFNGGHESAA